MSDGKDTPAKTNKLMCAVATGQSGNPAGRPKGARSRFSEKFINDFMNDWDEHGAAVIAQVRAEKPDVYLRTATAILPKVSDDGDDFDNLTPEELDARLADLEARTAALVGAEGAALRAGETGRKPH
jgi:hypothetical protein